MPGFPAAGNLALYQKPGPRAVPLLDLQQSLYLPHGQPTHGHPPYPAPTSEPFCTAISPLALPSLSQLKPPLLLKDSDHTSLCS